MPWNYRVVKQVYDGVACYGIHEVYYNDPDDDTTIWAVTESTVGLGSDIDTEGYDFIEDIDEDGYDELRQSYLMMGQALLKRPIDLDELVFAEREGEGEIEQQGMIPLFTFNLQDIEDALDNED